MIRKLTHISQRERRKIERFQKACNEGEAKPYYCMEEDDFGFSSDIPAAFYLTKKGRMVSLIYFIFEDDDSVFFYALTRPEDRRKGYFKELFQTAEKVLKSHGIINFCCAGFETSDFEYYSSEYMMKFEKPERAEKPEKAEESADSRTISIIGSESENEFAIEGTFKENKRYRKEFYCDVMNYGDGVYLSNIEVEKEFRFKGFGTIYMKKLEEYFDKPIYLQVTSLNKPAVRVYEKTRFKVIEEQKVYRYHNEHSEDERWMKEALKDAKLATEAGDVPIGCVIVRNNEIIARAYNKRNADKSALSHAEISAIKKANEVCGDWRLEDCTMYVTLEPCPMCAGAIVQARLQRVVIGAMNPKAGCAGSVLNLLNEKGFNHQPKVTTGILAEEAGAMLSTFFAKLRATKNRKI